MKRNAPAVLALVTALVGCSNSEPPPAAVGTAAPAAGTPANTAVGAVTTIVLPHNPSTHEPLVLKAGQVASGTFTSPSLGKLSRLGIFAGTYFNTSRGVLKLDVCKGSTCTSGVSDLKDAQDNTDIMFVLNPPLDVIAGDAIKFSLAKEGGEREVALWVFPATVGGPQAIAINDVQNLEGRTARLTLQYSGR